MMHNTSPRVVSVAGSTTDRLTVSLAEGQRDALESIAETNNATLSFVVRYALTRFIDQTKDRQLKLTFPASTGVEQEIK